MRSVCTIILGGEISHLSEHAWAFDLGVALGQLINLTRFQSEPGYHYLPKVLQLSTRTDKGMTLGV